MHDVGTLTFYSREAEAYAARYGERSSPDLPRFLAHLPPHGRVLELGCGGGQDAAEILARGFDVTATDGSPEMAAQASRRLGRPVRTLLVEDLKDIDSYDGVWASACLLHVPWSDLPAILARIRLALREGGWFYASYKTGDGEGRDRLGRYYNYPTEEALVGAYHAADDWRALQVERQKGSGYDGLPADWVAVLAQA